MKLFFERILSPVIVASILGLAAISLKVFSLEEKQKTYAENQKEIKSDLKTIRCLVGDKVTCYELKANKN